MSARNVLTVTEVGAANLARLVNRSVEIAAAEGVVDKTLTDRIVGVFFKKTSTRTRTSFTAGAMKLGADVITFGPEDLQIATGETLEDTGRTLAGYLDALVVRTNEDVGDMRALAAQGNMPVINAMSSDEHPTQAVADLSTLQEHFGALDGVHVLYVGEGNNSCAALALATALTPGMRLTVRCPEGYGLGAPVLTLAEQLAAEHGGRVEHGYDVGDLPAADAVYATRWHTMGVSKDDPDWRDKFLPYRVTDTLLDRVTAAGGEVVFLHDLPAMRGDDVTDAVLDGPRSLAWRQARHKMFSAMAILEWSILTS